MPTIMLDSTGDTAHNIPIGTAKVAGYATGTGGVQWTAEDWAMFPHSTHIRIDQGASDNLGVHDSDVLDVEQLAEGPNEVPAWVKARISAGITWSTVYASRDTWPAIRAALDAAGPHGWYFGHVNAWVADYNLDLAEAEALLGTQISGITIVAVQWASPTSNPRTLVPGGTQTLQEANVDISVTADDWFPPSGVQPTIPGIVVWHDDQPNVNVLVATRVTSTDNGKTWR